MRPVLTPEQAAQIAGAPAVQRGDLWIMVDVEASGPCPGLFSMTELGAIVVEPALDRTFYAQLKPLPEAGIQAEALAAINKTVAEIEAYPEPALGMVQFAQWLAALRSTPSGPQRRIRFICDNAGFDWQFVNYYCWKFLGENPFGHSQTHLGSLWKGYRRDFYSSFKRLRKTKHTHHPVDDAKGNAEAMLAMLDQWRQLGGPLR